MNSHYSDGSRSQRSGRKTSTSLLEADWWDITNISGEITTQTTECDMSQTVMQNDEGTAKLTRTEQAAVDAIMAKWERKNSRYESAANYAEWWSEEFFNAIDIVRTTSYLKVNGYQVAK